MRCPMTRREMKAARYLNWRINRRVNAEDTALIQGVQDGHGLAKLCARAARRERGVPAKLRQEAPAADPGSESPPAARRRAGAKAAGSSFRRKPESNAPSQLRTGCVPVLVARNDGRLSVGELAGHPEDQRPAPARRPSPEGSSRPRPSHSCSRRSPATAPSTSPGTSAARQSARRAPRRPNGGGPSEAARPDCRSRRPRPRRSAGSGRRRTGAGR